MRFVFVSKLAETCPDSRFETRFLPGRSVILPSPPWFHYDPSPDLTSLAWLSIQTKRPAAQRVYELHHHHLGSMQELWKDKFPESGQRCWSNNWWASTSHRIKGRMVEPTGLEPATPTMPLWCSTNWATTPPRGRRLYGFDFDRQTIFPSPANLL